MAWFLAELIRGENYPDEVSWPDGIDAFIPLSDSLFEHPPPQPQKNSVQLFWKKCDSERLSPLVWLNKKGRQDKTPTHFNYHFYNGPGFAPHGSGDGRGY